MKKFLPLAIALLFCVSAIAKKDKKKGATPAAKSGKVKSISDVAKKCKTIDGLFTVYRDTTNGTAYIRIKAKDFENEFIHFSHVADGVVETGFFRGQFRGSKIFKWERNYDKVGIRLENNRYYYDPENALSRAAKANINEPLVAVAKIVAEDKKSGDVLIKADDIFLNESFGQIKPSYNPKYKGYKLGGLSKSKTNYEFIKSFPQNTDFMIEYVYDSPYPKKWAGSAATDSRSISVYYQHSLIALPDNNYKPRKDSPLVGYFATQVNDMTTPKAINYKDRIHRWFLEPKEEGSTAGEPKEPITFWIENTTPMELRATIKEAVERWNIAFESAGWQNAVVCKIQPDSATWDAADIRYNVLRWTSSPRPPFGGYGPSFVNPRTGQIMGADIMLEYIYLTNRTIYEKLYGIGMDADIEDNPLPFDEHSCSAAAHMHLSNQVGMMAQNDVLENFQTNDFLKQGLFRLVLHEVGHTLGLNHNFMGSTLNDMKQVKNAELTRERGLCNSVMEYPSINIPLEKEKRGHYYDTKPGPYDLWAIEYGYRWAGGNQDEDQILNQIVERANDPELAFGNDADDMRSPGKGIDPRRMIYDLSSEPVEYAKERMMLVNQTYKDLPSKFNKEEDTWHDLRRGWLVLQREYATQLGILSRQIGGVYVDRTHRLSELTTKTLQGKPFTPVPAAKQKEALSLISKYAFAPDAFSWPDSLLPYLQLQRRGYSFFGRTEDPKPHDWNLGIQRYAMAHLLHKNVWKRITNTTLYGNGYDLASYANDLTDAVFKADWAGSVNTYRQNLQTMYVEQLMAMMNSRGYDDISQSVLYAQLDGIGKKLKANASRGDALTKAHRSRLGFQIEKALSTN